MDIKHKQTFVRISQTGVSKDIVLNDGMSLLQLWPKIFAELAAMPNRYQGVTIELAWKPINDKPKGEMTLTEMILADGGFVIEQATDEEEAEMAEGNPSDPNSTIYDPLYAEYVKCHNSAHRETKTPTDLTTLRRHVEANYGGTKWWRGFHLW